MALGEDNGPKLVLCEDCGEAVRAIRDDGEWRAVDGGCDACGGDSFRRFADE